MLNYTISYKLIRGKNQRIPQNLDNQKNGQTLEQGWALGNLPYCTNSTIKNRGCCRFGKSTHISMISNSVTHLQSYTNSDIAGNSAPISPVTPCERRRLRAERRRLRMIALSPNADVSTSSADVSASSADIVASNEECFKMFHNVLSVSWCFTSGSRCFTMFYMCFLMFYYV